MALKINKKWIVQYLTLYPFFYPSGFNEYSVLYKSFFTVWLYCSMLMILVYFVNALCNNKFILRKQFVGVFTYFVTMATITLFIQGGIGEGLQKIFATPTLIIFLVLLFEENVTKGLHIISNICLFNNALNCTLFNPLLIKYITGTKYIENITFVGHVQMCSQLGLLGIALAILLLNYGYKQKALLLIVLSFITMIQSRAIASYIAFVALIFAFFFYRVGGKSLIASISPNFIFLIGTFIQTIIVPCVILYKFDFGARLFVWIDAIRKLSGHYLLGFGVHGVLLHTFWMEWTDSIGMNYAHNEIMQLFLDGGIILFICYMYMCLSLISNYSQKLGIKTKYWFNCILTLFMAIGTCESVTEYNYFYLFLLLMFFLPSFNTNLIKKTKRGLS